MHAAAACWSPHQPHAPWVWPEVLVYSILAIQNCMYMYETLPELPQAPLNILERTQTPYT